MSSHLLRTSRIPSKPEASLIRQAIAQAKHDQEQLTHEITRLQATLGMLCNQSRAMDTFISEHEMLLTPACRILPEILSEIFLWCLADRTVGPSILVVIGQVCSYWRSVAISTPGLWSHLALKTNKNVQAKTLLVNTALSRSAARPLTIDLTSYVADHADACLDPILNHSHRWQCVSFDLDVHGLRKLSVVRHAVPILEELSISTNDSDLDMVLDAFEVAPQLRSLDTNMLPSTFKVPGEQLECFRWFGSSEQDCLEWLRRCPNLIECSVNIYGDSDKRILTTYLPRLIKLEIVEGEVDDGPVFGDLFNSLVTPILSDLRIEYIYVDLAQWAQAPFISFLRQSTLRKLDLADIPITDAQLIECLRLLPSLVELALNYNRDESDGLFLPTPSPPITDTLIRRLIYRPPELRLLPLLSPQLQVITFNSHSQVGGRMFGDMVASRWRIHEGVDIDDPTSEIACLKSVTWHWRQFGKLDKETEARLKKYNDEGLKLYIQ